MQLQKWNSKMNTLNYKMGKFMFIFAPSGVVLGLLLGNRISWMKNATTFLFGLMTFSGALSISPKDFVNTVKKPKFIFVYFAVSFLLMPLVYLGVSSLVFPSCQDLISGFVAIRAMPTAVSSTVWTSIYSGNMAISIALITIETFIAPFTTPAVIKLLTNTSTPIDSAGMVKSLFLMVVIPSILGMLLNKVKEGKIKNAIQPTLKPISKVLLSVVVMISCSSVRERLSSDRIGQYLSIAICSLFLVVVCYTIGILSSKKIFRFNEEDSVAMTFSIAMRNITATLVIAINYMPPDAALPAIFGILLQQAIGSIIVSIAFKGRS